MRVPAVRNAKLLVSLLLDIDHTLLSPSSYARFREQQPACPVQPGQWVRLSHTQGVCTTTLEEVVRSVGCSPPSSCFSTSEEVPPSYGVRVVFGDRERLRARDEFVVVRPYVFRFLHGVRHLHCLDTPHVEARLSLFTRQTESYCYALASQALLPVMHMLTHPQPTASVFDNLYHGAHCCGKELSSAPLSSGFDTAGWRKSVTACENPFTTLLLDDNEENFLEVEQRSGHCVQLPAFKFSTKHLRRVQRMGGCGDMEWRMEEEEATSLFGGVTPLLSQSVPDMLLLDATDPHHPSLVRLLQAFMECCETHASELAVLNDQKTAKIETFSFFEKSSEYSDAWMRFRELCT